MKHSQHEQEWARELSTQGLLDALTEHVAVLDEGGTILAVNSAWRRVGLENAADDPRAHVGFNYLQVCDSATGPRSLEAPAVAQAMRDVIAGKRAEYHCEYPCHSPDTQRWFMMHLTCFSSDGALRLVVIHDEITERKRFEDALSERVKELGCLYSIMDLMENPSATIDGVFQGAVDTIPASWQYPEITAARIALHGREYRTPGFAESRWTQRAEMTVSGTRVGSVEVCYLDEMPASDEGPFSKEARALIDAIAEHLSRVVEREQARETLTLNEARLNSLLLLFQRSADLKEEEIIQLALEEAVKLTFSAIGYCHLVHEDQESIELVTWSRETLKGCDAVHETHYPMNEAGVWADCARTRAPVVHNDYANFPERKGLPEGHATVSRHLSVPVVEGEKVRVIMGVGNKAGEYDDSDIRQLQLVANDAWQIVRRRRAEHQLEIMAMTDALTGLHNRRYLFTRGAEEVERVRRYGGPLSVLLLDIDTFKSINDTYGHDVGDSVLRDLAKTLLRSLREVDVVARVGGEEFAVLLPGTNIEMARPLAERLIEQVRQMTFESSGTTFGMTVSIGVASCRSSGANTFDALLKAADVALYEAKQSGRNCAVG